MMIALARYAERFGLSCVGVQYQQGLARSCAASDFAEGAIGSTERFPIPAEDGHIIRDGKPIPCANEVDMGTAIPQTMMFRLLDSLGLPSETTLHDIRWGSDWKGPVRLGLRDLRRGALRPSQGRHHRRHRLSPAGHVFPQGRLDHHRSGQGWASPLGARSLRKHVGHHADRHRPCHRAAGGGVRAAPQGHLLRVAAAQCRARWRRPRRPDGRAPVQHMSQSPMWARTSWPTCSRPSSPRRSPRTLRCRWPATHARCSDKTHFARLIMMKNNKYSGVWPVMLTPFTDNGRDRLASPSNG